MQALPLTRASLLVRIQDPADAEAWRQFFELYAPVVYGFARKRGLQDADAADLMQDVLRSVAMAAGRLEYDPAKGTFRGWLYSVTRNKIFNFLDKQRRQTRGSGDSGAHRRLEELPAPVDEREEWDRDYERRRFAWAADRIREEFHDATWKAFWMTAVDGGRRQKRKGRGRAVEDDTGGRLCREKPCDRPFTRRTGNVDRSCVG